MAKIKTLFDKTKDIYRTIEKVITYNANQEHRLKAEIFEYVVTESIEEQFGKLLSKMELAMESGGENEVGVWVSGFYGSGKSSFTKYLGLAFDEKVIVDGIPFIQHLQNRFEDPRTKALLGALTKRYPAAIVLLDLASEMLAGATMEDVSTVLYYKVLQWAGYSQNLKVAAFERKLKRDGRYEAFETRILEELDTPWSTVQNDPLVVDSYLPELAHEMYPELFKTPASFSTETSDIVRFENERVKEMIDIVRETTGKEYILFIVDEVGQYVGSRQNLILNLDGLAKNLKNIGDGKVWIFGTAQQTLTEDDPRAAINSPELYKLKDRFPITIDLESNDIREICYRRLLGKSPEGASVLAKMFTQHGPMLRHHTKLQDAKYYDSEVNEEIFTNLYPFLPAHFDILLHLLGALAKSTGGIGLRSAIKVIQDILIEGPEGHHPVADNPIGWLATTVTLYDTLEKDIRRAFPSLHQAVEKAKIRFVDTQVHQEVAKTVAVLQILSNLPVTAQNVASLMHPSVEAPSRREEVNKAIEELIAAPLVPFGEKDGNLCFFSEKLNNIEQERAQIPLRSMETRRIFSEALREAFNPLPSTRLEGNLVVKAGLKLQNGAASTSLAGDRETIQMVAELIDPSDYETTRTRLVDESRHRTARYIIFLLGRTIPELDDRLGEIYRCQEIHRRYKNDPDQEVKEYCKAQADRAGILASDLMHLAKGCFSRGSFIFQGQSVAVDSLDQELLTAAKKYLNEVAPQVFDRYHEAPVRVETVLAETFLRLGNLAAVTAKTDPMELVRISGGTPSIRLDCKALQSIRDYIDRNGSVQGKKMIEDFSDAPFGWSQDTLRYLIAGMLIAGEIKLNISGREVTSNGQLAIDALKTNNAFKTIGVSLRDERPSMELLARAAERLTDLIGDTVIPLENEISKLAARHLPRFQSSLAPLGEKLAALELPGADQVSALITQIGDLLSSDASDAPKRLGAEESSFYQTLKWAKEVDLAFKKGLEMTIRALQRHRRDILALPHSGIPGTLRQAMSEELQNLQERLSREDFYRHVPDLNTMLTNLEARCRDAAMEMLSAQKLAIKQAEEDLHRLPEWPELTREEQSNTLGNLEDLVAQVHLNLEGLKTLVNQDYTLNYHLSRLKDQIEHLGRSRRLQRLEEEQKKAGKQGKTKLSRSVNLPQSLTKTEQLDELIRTLQQLKQEMELYGEIEIKLSLIGETIPLSEP